MKHKYSIEQFGLTQEDLRKEMGSYYKTYIDSSTATDREVATHLTLVALLVLRTQKRGQGAMKENVAECGDSKFVSIM